jgi:outer membrane protein assembly factor BamB
LVPSPVAGGGVVLACGPKGEPIFAAPLGKTGVLEDEDLAWVSKERAISADVPTPLFYGGHFYVLDGNRKALSCVEPASGKVLWTGEFESRVPFESSPTGADGRVYCINHRGEVFVVKAQTTGFELVAQVEMGDENDRDVRATVVAAQGRLFIRTNSRLYCLGD